MTPAEKLLRRLQRERILAISPETIKHVRASTQDKDAAAFLKKGGFLDQRGKLAAKCTTGK